MNKVGLVLEQFVDAFYYISLTQHHLVPQGWENKNDGLGTEKSRASRAEIPDTRHSVFS